VAIDDEFDKDFYGYYIKLRLRHMIRFTTTFESLGDFVNTLEYDIALIKNLLSKELDSS